MNKQAKITIAAFFVVMSFSVLSQALAFDDGDFQYWNTENMSWKTADDWKIGLEQEFRFADDGSNPYYRHTDLGATYSGVAQWLDLGISYRQIFEEKSNDWKSENRPHLNAIVKFAPGGLKMENRCRFEYRNREDADNFWQYRNKLSTKLPFKFTSLEIQPYLADEIFVSFDQEELSRNRLYSGLAMKLINNLKAELFYLWQRSKSSSGGKWSDYNVLGTKLKLSF